MTPAYHLRCRDSEFGLAVEAPKRASQRTPCCGNQELLPAAGAEGAGAGAGAGVGACAAGACPSATPLLLLLPSPASSPPLRRAHTRRQQKSSAMRRVWGRAEGQDAPGCTGAICDFFGRVWRAPELHAPCWSRVCTPTEKPTSGAAASHSYLRGHDALSRTQNHDEADWLSLREHARAVTRVLTRLAVQP